MYARISVHVGEPPYRIENYTDTALTFNELDSAERCVVATWQRCVGVCAAHIHGGCGAGACACAPLPATRCRRTPRCPSSGASR